MSSYISNGAGDDNVWFKGKEMCSFFTLFKHNFFRALSNSKMQGFSVEFTAVKSVSYVIWITFLFRMHILIN